MPGVVAPGFTCKTKKRTRKSTAIVEVMDELSLHASTKVTFSSNEAIFTNNVELTVVSTWRSLLAISRY